MLAVTGGGSGALHALLSTPGASTFAGEAQIPYSPEALERFLGRKPEQAVSSETARALAETAFERARSYSESDISHPLGIACTAALRTVRERRGDDRAFICIKTAAAEKLYALHFSPASRAEQEALLSEWILRLAAHAVGAEHGLVLPGSFNPFHAGHAGLLRAAERITGLSGIFELSCANVDKPALAASGCLQRAATIRDIPVALTDAPRFVRKAELFPKTVFALGYDTAVRLIAYAAPDEWPVFEQNECRFLVAGRLQDGQFMTLGDLNLPAGFEHLFAPVPEEQFREDISSTGLRG